MHCPSCRAPLSFRFSLKIWNPHKFQCPSCKTILTFRKITGYIIAGLLTGIFMGFTGRTTELRGFIPAPYGLLSCSIIAITGAFVWFYIMWRQNKFQITAK
jgi:predicted transporter